jgi:hypothetical protein
MLRADILRVGDEFYCLHDDMNDGDESIMYVVLCHLQMCHVILLLSIGCSSLFKHN